VELLADPELEEHVTHALVSIGFASRNVYEEGCVIPRRRPPGTAALSRLDRPAGAISLVAPLIHDPSPEVRAEAIAAIGRLGDEDAPMLLFELLGDESELIQEAAMAGLAQLPSERVTPLLVQALGDADETVRIRAADTLGMQRDARSVPALLPLASDPRESVRRAAIKGPPRDGVAAGARPAAPGPRGRQ